MQAEGPSKHESLFFVGSDPKVHKTLDAIFKEPTSKRTWGLPGVYMKDGGKITCKGTSFFRGAFSNLSGGSFEEVSHLLGHPKYLKQSVLWS